MSIWSDMEDRGTGDLIKKEDLQEETRKLSNKILDFVSTYNGLVADVNDLQGQINGMEGFYMEEKVYAINFYSEEEVNETLKSMDYDRIKKLGSKINLGIYKLKKQKGELQREWEDAKVRWDARYKALDEEREKRLEERRQKEMEEEKRKSTKLLILFIVSLILGIVSGIFSGIQCAQSGEGWGCGILIGFLVFFSVCGVVGNELDL